MKDRLEALRRFLKRQELEAVVIQKPENQRYFSGFSGGEAFLYINAFSAYLFTDFRYIEQAQKEAPNFTVVRFEKQLFAEASKTILQEGNARIGFEGDAFTYDAFVELERCLVGVQLKPVQLDDLRMVKDEAELAYLKKAVAISDAAFTHILTVLRPGITELEVAAELENHMRRLGSERPAFDTIVASGARGSLPHGTATAKVIEAGDLVTMDFGAVYRGYHSDITRTVCVGQGNSRQKEVYQAVLKAQLAGLNAVKSGVSGKAVDTYVRCLLMDEGYGQYFGHGLGHGVGLAIHEQPRLSPSSTCGCLEPGMVVTVEPGVYIPDWGGVRIEDTVVVTKEGCMPLTSSSKNWIEIL